MLDADIYCAGRGVLCFGVLVRSFLRASVKGSDVNIEYIVSGLIALGLFAYLLYALLKPEKF